MNTHLRNSSFVYRAAALVQLACCFVAATTTAGQGIAGVGGEGDANFKNALAALICGISTFHRSPKLFRRVDLGGPEAIRSTLGPTVFRKEMQVSVGQI